MAYKKTTSQCSQGVDSLAYGRRNSTTTVPRLRITPTIIVFYTVHCKWMLDLKFVICCFEKWKQIEHYHSEGRIRRSKIIPRWQVIPQNEIIFSSRNRNFSEFQNIVLIYYTKSKLTYYFKQFLFEIRSRIDNNKNDMKIISLDKRRVEKIE